MGLISKTYKQFITLNNKKKNNPVEKSAGNLKPKKKYNGQQNMQRCSMSLIIKKHKSEVKWGTTSHKSECHHEKVYK